MMAYIASVGNAESKSSQLEFLDLRAVAAWLENVGHTIFTKDFL